MGTWDADLFSDDTACDICGQYRDLIEDGVDDAEATRITLNHFRRLLDDPEEGPLAWVALAVTQSKLGRLEAAVRDRALSILDSGGDLQRWQEDNPKFVAKRRAALEAARKQLVGPQPARKRLRPPKRVSCGLVAGDLLSLDLGNRLAIIRVMAVQTDRQGETPILRAFISDGPELPAVAALEALDPIQMPLSDPGETHFNAFDMQGISWETAGFKKVGQLPVRPGDGTLSTGSVGKSWASLAQFLRTANSSG